MKNLRLKLLLDYYLGGLLHALLKPPTVFLGKLLNRDHNLDRCASVTFIKMLGGGSLVMAYPALLAIKRAPQIREVRLVTTPAVRPFADALGVFDEIIVIRDRSPFTLLFDSLGAIWKLFRCETIVDLEIHSRLTTVFSLMTCARNRVGFYTNISFWRKNLATHLLFFNSSSPVYCFYDQIAALFHGVSPDERDCERTFRTKLGPACAGTEPLLAAQLLEAAKKSKAAGETASATLASLGLSMVGQAVAPASAACGRSFNSSSVSGPLAQQPGHDQPKCLRLALAPCCSDLGMERMLRIDDWITVLRRRPEAGRFEIHLLGGPSDRTYLERLSYCIAEAFPAARVLNHEGKMALSDSLRLLASCGELLAIDSALLHFARLLGIPTTSFWGPTDPQTRLRPTAISRDTIFYQKLTCSPCVHVAARAPCGGQNICMRFALEPDRELRHNPVWVLAARARNDQPLCQLLLPQAAGSANPPAPR